MILRLANISNGLVYNHNDVCHFQSNYGHHASLGYFRIDAMPYRAIIHLLRGDTIEIIDATASKHKKLSDGLKYGVPTWCIVFNRALNFKGSRHIKVCDWQTSAIKGVALQGHKSLVQSIRKLIKVYGYVKPAVIGDNVRLTCYNAVNFDDKSSIIKELAYHGRIM